MSVVFALATPPAKSAICVFRVSGAGCLKKLGGLFGSEDFDFGRFYVSDFLDGGNAENIFTDMLDQEIGKITSKRGIGIADMIYEQLRRS